MGRNEPLFNSIASHVGLAVCGNGFSMSEGEAGK